ncbi:phosphotransferase family protein [Streptomyces sp. NPDC057245]|uniref:phosphotransferase family protein n=1 Tax=Streptomyces TaxID=1883 RepID=UPI001C1E8B5F|nr:aminoglycoside phosphotransferase family protein [Streptomyces sp. A108]MBU6532960.1 aminoglycoside phosphotransferase family protein [Streptomyces sp. A108]
MSTYGEAVVVPPLALAWVRRQLDVGERIVGSDVLHGGITAEMRGLTVRTRDGGTRRLVLRSFVEPSHVEHAEDALNREADALTGLAATDVPAPGLVAVDPTAAHCEYPSLLMTHLPGRTVLTDAGLENRVRRLARQLVAIHAVRPAVRPPEFTALTTAGTVVTPQCADAAVWAAAIDVIRRPRPSYEGRFLHRDFQPGNVLSDVASADPARARITGVVDWASVSWGPADLDVAHCSAVLAQLHGPAWGLRFSRAYEEAGGVLAATESERLYWRVRDALACSEEVSQVVRPWREAGRIELTARVVEERLDAYVVALMGGALR